jgi:hypothetical protein
MVWVERGWSGLCVEEFFERDGLGAAGAHATGAQAEHEGSAFLASLLSEEAGAAVWALVDGVGFARLSGW